MCYFMKTESNSFVDLKKAYCIGVVKRPDRWDVFASYRGFCDVILSSHKTEESAMKRCAWYVIQIQDETIKEDTRKVLEELR